MMSSTVIGHGERGSDRTEQKISVAIYFSESDATGTALLGQVLSPTCGAGSAHRTIERIGQHHGHKHEADTCEQRQLATKDEPSCQRVRASERVVGPEQDGADNGNTHGVPHALGRPEGARSPHPLP